MKFSSLACCGAGLLNGQTVKNLQNSVPENHAGMASGLASTTRFIGNLASVVALLGAVLSSATRQSFTGALAGRGLSTAVVDAAASLVTSGNTSDLASIVSKVPPDEIRTTGQRAYSDGFAAAAFVAAAIASAGCVLPLLLVSGTETGPVEALNLIPCRTFDCRDPL
jgi:hypothetical protein